MKEDKAMVGDKLWNSIAETGTIGLNEIKEYINTLRSNKAAGPDGIKIDIYQ
jgi:hypothetical protein